MKQIENLYWKQVTSRYDEAWDEVYTVYIIGDETGPICEYTDKEEFIKACEERGIK